MDTFEIQAIDLDTVTKVTVGHDGKGAGAGWLLEKVVVHDPKDKSFKVFKCDRYELLLLSVAN